MVKIREAIVVEGRYDKAALASYLDALIVVVDGFALFHDAEKMALLRRLADERGLVVLTDPDGAGFVIRNHIKSAIDPAKVKHAYIPDIAGREKRKRRDSKEGKLGVEGVAPEIVLDALRKAGVRLDDSASMKKNGLSKADMYALGLSGRADSARMRQLLKQKLRLPEKMASNGLFEVLNALYDREELERLVAELHKECDNK